MAADGRGTVDPRPADILDTSQAGGMVVRGGALRAGSYLAGILLSLAAVPLMARHLGPGDFGWFVAVTSLMTIAGGLGDAGLATIGLREYTARDPEARRNLMQNLLGMRLAFTALAVTVAVAFSAAAYPSMLVLGTLIAGAALLLTDLQRVAKIPLAGSLRLGWVAALELTTTVALVASLILLVVAGAGLLPFFAAAVVAGAVGLGATLLVAGPAVTVAPAVSGAEWRKLLRETLPYAVALAIGIAAYRVSLIVLSLVTREQETGYFATAFRIVEVLAGIAILMVSSVFPILARAARDDEERLRYALQRVFEVATLVAVGVGVLVLVGAPLAIDFIGGAEYEPAVPALRIAAGAVVAWYLAVTWQYALVAIRRQRDLLVANGAAFVLAVTLSIALGKAYGAEGAAIALTAVTAVSALLYGLFLMRSRPALRVALAIVPKTAVAACAAILVGLLVPLPPAAALALTAVTYLVLLLIVRAIPQEIIEALPLRGRTALP